jgi:regulator of sirC expression with transglutaminase-like and TPR domain
MGLMEPEEAWRRLTVIGQFPEENIDLTLAALVLAATEYPKLDITRAIDKFESLAAGASRRLGNIRDPLYCVNTLSEYLFDELKFHGNEHDYYDPRNSYLNDVMARRLGIPITLSLIYIETGRRLNMPLFGVGMPGHFMVRHRDIEDLFIDPFYGGILLNQEECAERVRQVTQRNMVWNKSYLAPIGNREFLARMVRNLKGAHLNKLDYARTLQSIDWLLATQPEVAQELRDKGIVNYQLGNYHQALDDLRAYIGHPSSSRDVTAVRSLIIRIEGRLTEL